MSVLEDIERWKGEAASSSRARARKSTRVVEQKGRYMVSKSGIPSPVAKRKPFSDITNLAESGWEAPSVKRGAACRPAWGSPSQRGGSRTEWGSPSRRAIVLPNTPETPRMDVAAFLRGSTTVTTPPAAAVSAPAAPPPMSPELNRFSISTNLIAEGDEKDYQENDMQKGMAEKHEHEHKQRGEDEDEDDASFFSQEELRVKALVAQWLHRARESDADEKAMAVNTFEAEQQEEDQEVAVEEEDQEEAAEDQQQQEAVEEEQQQQVAVVVVEEEEEEEEVEEEEEPEQEPEENAGHIQEEGDGGRPKLELGCDSLREYPLSFHSFQETQETTEPEPEPEPEREPGFSKRDLDEVMAAHPQRGISMDAVLDSSASVDEVSFTATDTDDSMCMHVHMPVPMASKSTRFFHVVLICLPLVYMALCAVPAMQAYRTAMAVSAKQCMTIAHMSAVSALDSAGPVLKTLHATTLEAVAVARATTMGHMAVLEAPWREWSMAWAILMERSTPRLTQATGALSEVVTSAADDFHRRLLEITMGEEELAHAQLLEAGDPHDTLYVPVAALVGLTGVLGIWASRYLAAPKRAVPSV
jgi:hypothetical protein